MSPYSVCRDSLKMSFPRRLVVIWGAWMPALRCGEVVISLNRRRGTPGRLAWLPALNLRATWPCQDGRIGVWPRYSVWSGWPPEHPECPA